MTLSADHAAKAALWTPEHSAIASAEGWNLFDYDGTGCLQLQKEDDFDRFHDDTHALVFARMRAGAGCETSRLALALDSYFEQMIYPPKEAVDQNPLSL